MKNIHDFIAPGEFRYCGCGMYLVTKQKPVCGFCQYKPTVEDHLCGVCERIERVKKPATMFFVGGYRCNAHAFADPFLSQRTLAVDYGTCKSTAVATFSRMRPDYPFNEAAQAQKRTLGVHNYLHSLRNQIAENRHKAGCPPLFWMREGWEDSPETRDLLKYNKDPKVVHTALENSEYDDLRPEYDLTKLRPAPEARKRRLERHCPAPEPKQEKHWSHPPIVDTLRYKVYAGALHLDQLFRTYGIAWFDKIDLGNLDQNRSEKSVLGQLFCHSLLSPIPFKDFGRLGFAYHDRYDRMIKAGEEMTAMWRNEIMGRRNLREYPSWRYGCNPYNGPNTQYRMSFGLSKDRGEVSWIDLGDLEHPCYMMDFLSHPWDFISGAVKNTLFQNIMRRG